jgi:hypothetical protein
MSGNRTTIIIVGCVIVVCLCLTVISIGAGGYFYFNRNDPSSSQALDPSRIIPGASAPTPRANIAQPTTQAFPNPTQNPNSNPPAFPTITGGGICNDVEEFEDQGGDHIRSGAPHPRYNSNPPTSGWHWENPQDWGVYSKPQVQEQIVHNLEHGGIVIQYNNLSAAELQRLLDFVKRTPRHIVVAPYPGLDPRVRVAFTAWTFLQNCDGVDLEALADFVDEFRDQGPESVP